MKTTLSTIATLLLFASCGTNAPVEETSPIDTTAVTTSTIVTDSALVDTICVATSTITK